MSMLKKMTTSDYSGISDFIDDYIKMENGKYTKKEFQKDMMAMFSAAVDTTYAALSFALLTIGHKPKLQQELSEEMVNAFGDDFDSIKLKENITKIPKLRLYPRDPESVSSGSHHWI